MGVSSGCGCKEVYRLPHYYLSLLLLYLFFLRQHPYFLLFFKMFFVLYVYVYCTYMYMYIFILYLYLCFSAALKTSNSAIWNVVTVTV